MTTRQRAGSQPGQPSDEDTRGSEELRRDIERTREELGDTVEALAAKTDLSSRAREKRLQAKAAAAAKASAAKESVQTQAGRIGERVRQTSPGDAAEMVKTIPAKARRHRAELIVATAAVTFGLIVWQTARWASRG